MNTDDVEQAAIRLLANREHSRLELQRKLSARFHDSDAISRVLDGLEEQDYLSDKRFAEQYLKSRIKKGYGPLRINAELQERGIEESMVSVYLPDYEGWYNLMQQTAMNKFGSITNPENKLQQKIARFLEYRGFPVSMIRRFLWDD